MSLPRHDAYDAGMLLAYALEPKRRPAKADDYNRLVQRFQRERDFRQLIEELCKGMRLVILDCGPEGLALGCHADSVFSTRLSEFRRSGTFEDRVAYGLVYLAIGAWCFPRPEDLDDDNRAISRVVPSEVAEELVRWCSTSEEDEGKIPDAPVLDPEEREARRVILQRAKVRETETGRQGQDSIQGMIEYALGRLAQQGMMQEVDDDSRRIFRSTERFRLQVREMAGHQLLELLRDSMQEGDR